MDGGNEKGGGLYSKIHVQNGRTHSGDRTPNGDRYLDRTYGHERPQGEERSYSYEKSIDGNGVHHEEGRCHPASMRSTSPLHRSCSTPFQSSRSASVHGAHNNHGKSYNSSCGRNNNSCKHTNVKSHSKHMDKALAQYDECCSLQDSASSVFRGHWKNPPDSKTDLVTSNTSAVKNFVQAQAKALGKFSGTSDICDAATFFGSKEKNKAFFSEQKVVTAVLAFQRWRHTQLKKIFSSELKKVLDEVKEDEECLATLEQELANRDKHLAQLRSQLSAYERASREHSAERQMIDINVKEIEQEMMKALERATVAEGEVHQRDVEMRRLRERVKSLDTEGVRIDSELQASITMLQNEKESALGESRVLLAQLSRRDEAVAEQGEEIEKLRSAISRLAERQNSQHQQMEALKVEHKTQLQNLQVQLEQARVAKQAQEELQGKLDCTTEESVKASEEVAEEMVQHLKRLTSHMKELETSVDQHVSFFPGLKKKPFDTKQSKLSTELGELEENSCHPSEIGTGDLVHETCLRSAPLLVEKEDSRKHVCFVPSTDRLGFNRSITDRMDEETCSFPGIPNEASRKDKEWTAWKWRWAATAARADLLEKQLQLQNQELTKSHQGGTDPEMQRTTLAHERAKNLKKKVDLVLSGEFSFSTDNSIMEKKLVPLIFSAWRAFAKVSSLEKRALSRSASLDKVMSALPWWIRRVGDRRLVERFFSHWQLLTLRSTRGKQQQQHSRKKLLSYASPKRFQEQYTAVPSSHSCEVQLLGLGGQVLQSDMIPESRTVTPHRPRSAPGCPTVLGRRNVAGATATSQSIGPKEKYSKNGANVTFTARALRALQVSLQQELNELQYLLAQEIHSLQQQVSTKQQSAGRNRQHGVGGGVAAESGKTLRSIWDVCNNLAQALTDVRAQLSAAENVNSRLEKTPPRNRTGLSWDTAQRPPTRNPRPLERDGAEEEGLMLAGREKPCRSSSPIPRLCREANENCNLAGQQSREETHCHSSRGLQTREMWRTPGTARYRRRPSPVVTKRLQQGGDASTSRCRDASTSGFASPHQVRGEDGNRLTPLINRLKTVDNQEATSSKVADCNHTTVVQILSKDNKLSEVAIRTTGKPQVTHGDVSIREPIAHNKETVTTTIESKSLDDHTSPTPLLTRPNSQPTGKKQFDRSLAISSLKRKKCIGLEYAELLKSEIVRLREGRVQMEDTVDTKEQQLVVTSPSCRRPTWRPYSS